MPAAKKTTKKATPRKRASGNPAVRASTPEEVAGTTARRKKPRSDKIVVHDVTIAGEKYRLRGSQYLMMRVGEHLDDIDEDGDNITPRDANLTIDAMLNLFDDRDGTKTRLSSRQRVRAELDAAEIDFDDLEGAINRLMSLVSKKDGRPLG